MAFDSTIKNTLFGTTVKVAEHERAIVWKGGQPHALLGAGEQRLARDKELKVEFFSRREPWLRHASLDILKNYAPLAAEVEFLELSDTQRALVWQDKRFSGILMPGLYAWWKGLVDLRCEVKDIGENDGRFEHEKFEVIAAHRDGPANMKIFTVSPDAATIRKTNGREPELLPPGRYAYWNGTGESKYLIVDLREKTLDINGQDIMTADKVTLRLNVSLAYHVTDAIRYATVAEDPQQSLYREAQLLLRAAVGGRELDALLADKDSLSKELAEALIPKGEFYGLRIGSLGVRDIILPGDMKDLLNKVMEAKKAAEAAIITRREETSSMRHQLNTARMLSDNPALMRLRELETLEKVAASGKLSVMLSDKGLADKITNLI